MTDPTVTPGVRIVDMPDLGAVTDGSSFVGEKAGSGRFLASALRDYLTGGGTEAALRIAGDEAEAALRIAGDDAEATARILADAALVSPAMDPVVTAASLPAARQLFLALDDGSAADVGFPLVGSVSTGWMRHTSTVDPVTGSANIWSLAIDGVERYRFFASVMSCNLPPGDNWGITDGTRVFHIGNDGLGYYVETTTDHMLRVGSHNGSGPGITFGDQASGGTGFTGRSVTVPGFPFCFGTPDFSGASDGLSISDGADSVIRITNAAGGTTRQPMAFYRTGGAQVGSINTTDTTTAYATTSDERLKTVVGPISNSGALIDQLAPFWHRWTGAADTGLYAGMSAQAVNQVVLGAVVPGNDKQPGEPGFSPWQADWSKLVPLLIAEVKALRARVATLEAKP